MARDEAGIVDLEALALRGGEAAILDLRLRPAAPVSGGRDLAIAEDPLPARLDVSRTSSGYALRLRSAATLSGECARCLDPAEQRVEVDVREVDQPATDDEELRSPYVSEARLDAEAWLHDAITLALPDQVLCRPGCAGLCEICGASLNEVDPDRHRHERPPDPRFAKLRELAD